MKRLRRLPQSVTDPRFAQNLDAELSDIWREFDRQRPSIRTEIQTTVKTETKPSTSYDIIIWRFYRPNESERLLGLMMDRAIRFPPDLSGSMAFAETVSTGNVTLSIKKNGTEIGTIVWVAGETYGTFSVTDSERLFSTGDVLSVDAPSVRDNTFARFGITIKAEKVV